MKLFEINTTAYEEENLLIITDLNDDDITEVVSPLVNTERDGYEEYDNEILYNALVKRYPYNVIILAEREILEF